MGERVKTGIVLFLLYGLLFALSQLYQVVPGLSGLRLQAMLSVPYGLIFGRTGAIAAALGAAAAMAVTGGNPNFIPIEFLGALLSAYLPFRIWQGMRSPQEPYLCVEDQRTATMYFILSLIGAIPMAVFPAVGGDLYQVVPFPASYPRIFLASLVCTVVGGFLVYSQAAPRMFRGAGEALWNRIRDTKGTTRSMAVAMLRITLTGGFLGLGLAFIFPNEFELLVVEYVMGIFAALLFILTAV